MALLGEKDREYLKNLFAEKMENDVKVVFFTQNINCEYCPDTEMILKEVEELSDKIKVDVHNFATEKELAEKYGVDKVPAIIPLQVKGDEEKDFGIRFFGIPSGYEFTSLIESIIGASTGKTDLSEKTKNAIKNIKEPVHIQVFITPTCPYCPRAVMLSHKMAIESEAIRADMIESIEFPQLADKYGVYAVPKVVINDKVEFEGALPEPQFLEKVLEAVEVEV